MSRFTHDPDAVLDYTVDWTSWLADGETITSHEIVTGDKVTVDSSTEDTGLVTVWISEAEKGVRQVTCRVVTSEGRTDDRTITLHVTDR